MLSELCSSSECSEIEGFLSMGILFVDRCLNGLYFCSAGALLALSFGDSLLVFGFEIGSSYGSSYGSSFCAPKF